MVRDARQLRHCIDVLWRHPAPLAYRLGSDVAQAAESHRPAALLHQNSDLRLVHAATVNDDFTDCNTDFQNNFRFSIASCENIAYSHEIEHRWEQDDGTDTENQSHYG